MAQIAAGLTVTDRPIFEGLPNLWMLVQITLGLLCNLFWVSWPVAVALYLHRTRGPLAGVNARLVATCYLGLLALVAPVTLIGVTELAGETLPLKTFVFFFVACLVGAIAAFYIFWSAARALVCAEAGQKVGHDRIGGTFLQFGFLLLTIYFVQRRLHRLSSADLTPSPT